jgi:HEAT repeat protein
MILIRLLFLPLFIAGICFADEPVNRWTYESLRKHFESRKTAEEKYGAIHLLDTDFAATIIRKEIAEADRAKLLRIFLEDDDLSVRNVAVGAITFNNWSTQFSKELIAMLAGNPSEDTIRVVAEAMGSSKHEPFTPHLVKLLDHPNPDLQLNVAGRLSFLNPKLGYEFLAPRITDFKRDLDQRIAAIRQLHIQHFLPAIRLMTALTKAPEPELRREATERLGLLHSRDHTATFTRLLTDKDAQVRGLAAKALATVLDRTETDEDAIATLLKDSDPFVRRTAADALRSAGAKRLLPEIKKLRNDPDEKVRQRARIIVSLMERKLEKR